LGEWRGKTGTGLRLLAQVMGWDDPTAEHEFAWMQFMARLKYDDYRDFVAGMRFLESLVAWLQQFDPADRAAAYGLVRNRLVFVSAAERQRLVERLYPGVIWPELVQSAAQAAGVAPWRVLVDPTAQAHIKRERRATLFLALSDGARLDTFRHANAGRISNEQVVVTVDPSPEKWRDLLDKLRKQSGEPEAVFRRIVLVDDFTASGTSLIRLENGAYTGKLPRFLASLKERGQFCQQTRLIVHHLIGTRQARDHIDQQIAAYRAAEPEAWSVVEGEPVVTYGHLFDATLPLDPLRDAEIVQLTQAYYDAGIQNEHTAKGGSADIRLGYAKCGLPLVLDHHTPNNSIALLLAESDAPPPPGHRIRARFRFRRRIRPRTRGAAPAPESRQVPARHSMVTGSMGKMRSARCSRPRVPARFWQPSVPTHSVTYRVRPRPTASAPANPSTAPTPSTAAVCRTTMPTTWRPCGPGASRPRPPAAGGGSCSAAASATPEDCADGVPV